MSIPTAWKQLPFLLANMLALFLFSVIVDTAIPFIMSIIDIVNIPVIHFCLEVVAIIGLAGVLVHFYIKLGRRTEWLDLNDGSISRKNPESTADYLFSFTSIIISLGMISSLVGWVGITRGLESIAQWTQMLSVLIVYCVGAQETGWYGVKVPAGNTYDTIA